MSAPQADFKSLKQRIPIDHVLARYGVKLRSVGPRTLYGRCPLPTHTSRQSRQSFSVNLSLQVWSCHSASCIAARGGHMGGHVVDLVAIMERCGLREAGLRLQDWFGAGAAHPAHCVRRRWRLLLPNPIARWVLHCKGLTPGIRIWRSAESPRPQHSCLESECIAALASLPVVA